jgi:hypothetical protein
MGAFAHCATARKSWRCDTNCRCYSALGRRGTRLVKTDRWFWGLLSRIWIGWRTALVIVKPETIIAWHRRGFRLWWAWKSRRRMG